MSYALRNSLILGILLVVVLSAGAYWVGVRRVAQIEVLQSQEEVLRGDLGNINAVLAIYDSTQAKLDRLRRRWQARRQIVPARDTSARTLAYIYSFLERHHLPLAFDFRYKRHEEKTGYSVNWYGLEGEGRFENLYSFVWQMEEGRRFYTVDHLQIKYEEPDSLSDAWEWVQFKMILRAYFEPNSQVEDLPPSKGLGRPDAVSRNPFRPLVAKTLPENIEGLLEVDNARLMGVAYDLAYLVDERGQVHLLRVGDPVFLGRLDEIDIEHNRITFLLNRGGLWERVILETSLNK